MLGGLRRVLFDEFCWYEEYDRPHRKEIYEDIYKLIANAIFPDHNVPSNEVIEKTVYLDLPEGNKLEIRLSLNLPGFIKDGTDCKGLFWIEFDEIETSELMEAQHIIYERYFLQYAPKIEDDDEDVDDQYWWDDGWGGNTGYDD